MIDPNPDTPGSPASTLRKGDKVEQYTIKRQIGSGGSSIVFKAVDELLGQTVAIKQFIHTDDPGGDTLHEKIRTEARLHKEATSADPTHLVQMIDTLDGPYGLLLVSEYIDGPSLEQILAQNPGPMEPKQALGIAAATALALDAIHSRGIVHLDLKPANILMPRAGGLKVSDFGLAADQGDKPPTAGTARYMAPELFRGQKIDGRADVYALGMLVYEMLAGREKFDQAFKQVLRDQRNQAVRWMKWHTNLRSKAPPLNELLPGVSPRLAELVARMIEKDPEQRVGSAKKLVKAIKRHFAGKDGPLIENDQDDSDEVPTSTTTPGDTAELPARSGTAKYAVIAVTVCVLIGSGAGLWVLSKNMGEQRQVRQAARQTMRDASDAYRDGRYDQAVQQFQHLIDTLPDDSDLVRHARARALLAQGRIDADAGLQDQAIKAFEQAGDLGKEYRDKAHSLINDAQQAKAFADTVGKIESLIASHAYGEARKELDAWRDLTATDEEQQTLRSLGARLEDQLARWRVSEIVQQARGLSARGKRDEAIDLLKGAPKRLAVSTLLKQLQADTAYDDALAQGDAAIDRGETEGAIDHYQTALDARPNEALKQKLLTLRSDWLLEEGLRMLALGNTVDADRLLTESLGYHPDNQRAREALAKIATSGRRLSFIEAGDAAADRRDFQTAMAQYENGMKLGVDEDLTAKLTGARVQVQLARSRELLEAGRIEEATELVNQAKQMVQDSPDVAAVLREVEVRSLYLRHLKAGDEARARSAFGEAKRHYREARKAMDTPQIKDRLDQAEYDHILAQARDFIAAGEYPSAMAQLQVAAGIRMTDEVQSLLDEVAAKDPSVGEASP
jgi:serine/threonine protein kinase/tetratricopeptide (TPR) repeat protein